MATQPDWITLERDGTALTFRLAGDWSVSAARAIDTALVAAAGQCADAGSVALDLTAVDRLDTAGAWLIERTRRRFEANGTPVSVEGAHPSQTILLHRMQALALDAPPPAPRYSGLSRILHRTGVGMVDAVREAVDLLNFLGVAWVATARVAANPRRFRFVAFVSHLESVGLNAVPIVGLLSFVIGVVLAYQGADQLRRFGAEIFTINLLGISVLREMAILMTAIIVAGRSGSAFTAQIGTMQVNEEIDAMRAIGLDPVEVLVLPRAFALVVALPLLVVFADFMGLLGGAVMVLTVLDISSVQFTERLRESVPVWAFWVGLIKAPIFGFVIALIGCREGLKVSGSAESVGQQTTRAVVISIFAVMVLDGFFSVFFSAVGV